MPRPGAYLGDVTEGITRVEALPQAKIFDSRAVPAGCDRHNPHDTASSKAFLWMEKTGILDWIGLSAVAMC